MLSAVTGTDSSASKDILPPHISAKESPLKLVHLTLPSLPLRSAVSIFRFWRVWAGGWPQQSPGFASSTIGCTSWNAPESKSLRAALQSCDRSASAIVVLNKKRKERLPRVKLFDILVHALPLVKHCGYLLQCVDRHKDTKDAKNAADGGGGCHCYFKPV